MVQRIRRTPGLTKALKRNIQIPIKHHWTYHVWIPLLKSSLEALEGTYPQWFAYLRSHFKGRYDSTSDASGTPTSEDANSQEEDPGGVWQVWTRPRL